MWAKFPHIVTIYFLLAVAFYVVSGDDRYSIPLRWFCVLACLVMLTLGLLQLFDWIGNSRTERGDVRKRTALLDQNTMRLEIISAMTPSQLEFARWNTEAIQWEVLPASGGPVFKLVGSTIPMSFVREVLADSTATHVAPQRNYSEGSTERGWYNELLGLMCDRWGMAKRTTGGPKSATWTVDYNRVLWRFGMLDEEALS